MGKVQGSSSRTDHCVSTVLCWYKSDRDNDFETADLMSARGPRGHSFVCRHVAHSQFGMFDSWYAGEGTTVKVNETKTVKNEGVSTENGRLWCRDSVAPSFYVH